MSRGRVVILGWADSSHVQRWATGLTARGFEMSVVSVGGIAIPGIATTIYSRGDKGAYLLHAFRARRDVFNLKPDLVHCHYAAGFGLWTQLIQFHPTLVSVWGSDVVDVRGISRWMVKRTLNRADWVSATGDFLRSAALSVSGKISEKLSVIPFGVTPPESVSPLPDGPVRLCFLKEHRAIYGPDILVEAFALARRSVPDLRLTLAGSGPMTDALRGRLKALELEAAVKFPGYLEHREVVKFLSDHHILVMPSRMESFGVAALEAASCARPVIATRVGGIPEVVLDGTTGLLVKPDSITDLAEAIVRLASDRSMMTRLGEAGRRFVRERYLWESSLDQMCELYDRLIADAKSNSIL
jgi:glycosyltransferase involved in cell wall biosynthesis